MLSRITAATAALAFPLLILSACSSGESEPVEVTVTSTAQPSTTTPSSSVTPSSTTSSADPTPSQEPAAAPAPAACGAVGYTAAPGHESPHCLGKQIASCGTANHQTGTTFFTDGTSGWTQTCQDQMQAAYVPPAPDPVPTFDQNAYNEQFAEEYWRTHPRPTFDPDSADGYGPDQELPPACLRLEGVDC